jgi:uncharacterized NAD(P)/FAD-binding protein YdhS
MQARQKQRAKNHGVPIEARHKQRARKQVQEQYTFLFIPSLSS